MSEQWNFEQTGQWVIKSEDRLFDGATKGMQVVAQREAATQYLEGRRREIGAHPDPSDTGLPADLRNRVA